jgi:hypothetical protein
VGTKPWIHLKAAPHRIHDDQWNIRQFGINRPPVANRALVFPQEFAVIARDDN